MKIIFRISTFLLLLSSVIFMVSCNKQDAAFNTPKTVDVAQKQLKLSNVKLENGMLVFNTKADLDFAIALIQKNQNEGPKWIYDQFPDYVSHKMGYNSLTTEEYQTISNSKIIPDKYKEIAKFVGADSSKTLMESISSIPFSILANKDGFFGYGDNVFKIGSSATYSTTKNYYLANTTLDFTKLVNSSNDVKISFKGFNGNDAKSTSFRNATQSFGKTAPARGGIRRLGVYVWNNYYEFYDDIGNYINYSEVDCWSQYERSDCSGWFCHQYWIADWARSISQNGSVGLSSGQTFNFSNSQQNTGQVYNFTIIGPLDLITSWSVFMHCQNWENENYSL